MASFEDYIFELFASQIAQWDWHRVQDAYALGFLVHFEDQDLRNGTVGLVYNTLRDYRSVLDRELQPVIAADPARVVAANVERKWHFDYWGQHSLWVEGSFPLVAKGRDPHADPVGVALRRAWIEEHGLWYSDEEEEADFDKAIETGGRIAELFCDACVGVARRLHSEGTLTRKWGRPLPVIFHNYWYDAEAAQLTYKANPPGLAEEFERYVLVVRHS